MPLYRMYAYDVWGNEEDGYEVNDIFRTADTVEIPPGASDDKIKKLLRAEGIIDKGVRNTRIELEDDGSGEDDDYHTIYINDAKLGKPFGELRKEKE